MKIVYICLCFTFFKKFEGYSSFYDEQWANPGSNKISLEIHLFYRKLFKIISVHGLIVDPCSNN